MTKSGWLGLGGALLGIVSTGLGVASELLGKKEKNARDEANMEKYVNKWMEQKAHEASSEQ